jgi:streptomycin 6-kinase
MVRVLEQAQGAALFERIVPGTELVELSRRGRDDDATGILADVIASMSPDPAPPWSPTVSELGRGFAWYVKSGDTQIPPALVHGGSETYAQLCDTQRATRLLHGDLQHYNVLRDERRGWLAIDPKGVVGEVEYEVGASLRNPGELPDLLAEPATIERRVGRMASHLGLDADRVLRWAYADAVLSAIWLVQDGHVVDPDSPPLRLAHTLEKMLAGAG